MLHLFSHRSNVIQPRDIGFYRERSPAQRLHFARSFLDLSQGPRHRDNVGALMSEADRNRFADAAAGARDEGHFSV
jgi:hypothetical protein